MKHVSIKEDFSDSMNHIGTLLNIEAKGTFPRFQKALMMHFDMNDDIQTSESEFNRCIIEIYCNDGWASMKIKLDGAEVLITFEETWILE